jgi:16S rRNA (guanine966-N2)-methyltransferase
MMPNKKQSQLRIIAGQWRGRKITFQNIESVRPTTDRIRETVFNWLIPYIENAHCLDAFAGSGILGFEALSRGAAHITCIDQSSVNIQSILENAQRLNVTDKMTTHTQDFFTTTLHQEPFDIVFIDPPYHQQLLNKALMHLMTQKWIHSNTIIYVESEKKIMAQIPTSFNVLKHKSTKTIAFSLIQIKK